MSKTGTFRTGNHWGTTIIENGRLPEAADGTHADDRLVAVVLREDAALAERICDSLNGMARRGDPVAEWLKRWRDTHEPASGESWDAIDALLDDYRDHADTGTPLSEDVQGPHGEGA